MQRKTRTTFRRLGNLRRSGDWSLTSNLGSLWVTGVGRYRRKLCGRKDRKNEQWRGTRGGRERNCVSVLSEGSVVGSETEESKCLRVFNICVDGVVKEFKGVSVTLKTNVSQLLIIYGCALVEDSSQRLNFGGQVRECVREEKIEER